MLRLLVFKAWFALHCGVAEAVVLLSPRVMRGDQRCEVVVGGGVGMLEACTKGRGGGVFCSIVSSTMQFFVVVLVQQTTPLNGR